MIINAFKTTSQSQANTYKCIPTYVYLYSSMQASQIKDATTNNNRNLIVVVYNLTMIV